ncbi:MAG: MarR family transcriptional regulator [Mycobacterium sp.]|uniref:MarR family winged helix-turn-helix transcriptional regulator n=1 Tax=Mycobacterium sp. TaxID=1785 RepID=UPI003C6151A2
MTADERTRVITLIAVVRSVARQMVDELVARLQAAGYPDTTPAQHLVFENLDPDGTRLTTLAQRAGVSRQAITELVTGLQRSGYLELKPDPSDGRARLVHPTRKGAALLRVALSEISELEARWLESAAQAGLTVDLRQLLESVAADQRSDIH